MGRGVAVPVQANPRPLHAWRAALLRLFGARLGQHFHVHASCRLGPWQLTVGDHVGVGEGVHFYNMAPSQWKTKP